MSAIPSDLEELRRRIDEIDARLHDLLIERAKIVAGIATAKKDGEVAALQPDREAAIIRRLARRHFGEFPLASLVRIWREILSAMVRMQGPFAVAVYAPPESPGFWDLARDHYGSHAAMLPYHSVGQVIRAVGEGQATVGVLPVPQEGDHNPWWLQLLSNDGNAPRVIARLPFGARGNARTDGADALVIGRLAQRETGEDRTLFAAETAADISRARILTILSALPLDCTFLASWDHDGGALKLIEVAGFVPLSDPRLEQFREQLGAALYRLVPFGGYAVPPAGVPGPTAAAVTAGAGLVLGTVRG
jgi:chorismate mutase / prephenate dehydratase